MNALWTHFCAGLLAVGVMLPAAAAQPLISPAELAVLQEQPEVRVIDIRSPRDYEGGHIAGSVSAPYAEWRGPARDPGTLPPQDALVGLVRRLGVDAGTQAVIVSWGTDGLDTAGAARVYWTLKYLGLTQLSILNGGMVAWKAADLPLSLEPARIEPSAFIARPDTSIVATTEQVLSGVLASPGNGQARLVDARPPAFYRGAAKVPDVAVAGTIAGAVDVPYTKWFKPGTGAFVSVEQARTIVAAGPAATAAEETVTFCNTGHLAAADWFALSELLGQKNVRLYPESLVEWARDPALPMQDVPSRGQQILHKLKAVFG
ncbi:MAG: sulfurtransferase [Nevskiaceae bacterium]|nr:MAG: sulfurtransferase [Nevskiaceae bacterium]TBR74476.1 MAG: sulfurtransferase [Nevskiaceae bacterium]